MRRREFIALAGGSVALPIAALAQEPGRIYRLGILAALPRSHPASSACWPPHMATGPGPMGCSLRASPTRASAAP